jgi:hypothetical protein
MFVFLITQPNLFVVILKHILVSQMISYLNHMSGLLRMPGVFLLAFCSPAFAQNANITVDTPEITRILPAKAAAETGIEIAGYRLGANLNDGVRILFQQGAAEYEAKLRGGGFEGANVLQGQQELYVVVPKQLQAGRCQITVEVNGRSTPFEIEISPASTPPVIGSIRPGTPRPSEMIWITGSGFAESDDVQITDATGTTRHFYQQYRSSDANTIAVRLPDDLPAGEAIIHVVEHRSGTERISNSLLVTINHGPTPLEISSDWMMPVAPGQWLDLVIGSDDPLKGAERVDVSFEQRDELLVVPASGLTAFDLRVQVPATLKPGVVNLKTRTIVKGEASAWSIPIEFRLVDSHAPPKITSLQFVPVRVQAAFRQQGRIVAVTDVSEKDYPRVRVPTEKLSPGNVDVLTRVWRGGVPSEWLFRHYGFGWPDTTFLPDGTMGDVPFLDAIPIGADTAKSMKFYPGEALILNGTFPVGSAEEISVVLKSEEGSAISLNAVAGRTPRYLRINLPSDLAAGDYELYLSIAGSGAESKLPMMLRVG